MAPPNLAIAYISLMPSQGHDVITIDSSGPIDSWEQVSFQFAPFNPFL